MFPNAKFVPQEEYKSWIKKQPNYKKITAEHILLTEERPQQQNKQNKHYESFVIANNSSNYYYKKQMYFINRHSNKILYKFKMNIEKIKKIRILNDGFLKSVKGRKEFSKFMIKDLNSDSQILLIHSILKQTMFPGTYEPIPYAEHIINEASKIANRLESSYIAIHWRMEGALQENLPNCARKLVKKIQGIRKNTGIKNVYLATDVPITCEKNGSLTMIIGKPRF
ncbi:22419_t:CDS:2 [Entrophospora sp. SA101]|nr:22419_t:CDS:2 [Entrophospora sp. SA101]